MTTTPDLALAADFPAAGHEQWRALVDKVLKGADFDRKLVSRTYDDIAIQPLYTAADSPAASFEQFPGQPNLTRGVTAAGPPHGAWEIRQTQLVPDPAAANAAILEDLDGGVNSLALRLDVGGAGAVEGVVIGSGADLGALLDGVYLDLVTIVLESGASFAEAASLLVELWDERGVSGDERRGSFGADPLGALAAAGSLPQGLDAALAAVADLGRHTAAWPHVRAVDVDTAPYVDAGASEAEELAIMVAAGVTYLRALVDGGLSVEVAARQIGFTIAADADVFATIAKIRAARRLWAHTLEASGVPEATGAAFAARTATRMMSRRDPWVNMLRTTAACFAAGAAGAATVTVQPFDAALGLPDGLARRIARNTQLVLQEESHIGAVIDPAGGSYFIERLTDQLTARAWERFQAIEAGGGLAAVLLDGSEAKVLAATRDARMSNIARRKDPLTGVSEFPNLAEEAVVRPAFDVDALRSAARSSWSATVAGPATEIEPLGAVRLASEFEALRDASDAHLTSTGRRPTVFLANLGPVAVHTARASFAKNFFEAGGVETVGNDGFADEAALVAAFGRSGCSIAVICSSDGVYAERAASTAGALEAAGAAYVFLAGNPGDRRDEWTGAGVDEFIHVGVDVLTSLRAVHELEGVAS